MIKHVVLFKLKDQAEGADKAENIRRLKSQLEGLVGKIPEITSFEIGLNFDKSPAAYDVVLCSEFESEEALRRYQKHPEHMNVFDFVKKACESRVLGDYVI